MDVVSILVCRGFRAITVWCFRVGEEANTRRWPLGKNRRTVSMRDATCQPHFLALAAKRPGAVEHIGAQSRQTTTSIDDWTPELLVAARAVEVKRPAIRKKLARLEMAARSRLSSWRTQSPPWACCTSREVGPEGRRDERLGVNDGWSSWAPFTAN